MLISVVKTGSYHDVLQTQTMYPQASSTHYDF
jgi:hypothetical protein